MILQWMLIILKSLCSYGFPLEKSISRYYEQPNHFFFPAADNGNFQNWRLNCSKLNNPLIKLQNWGLKRTRNLWEQFHKTFSEILCRLTWALSHVLKIGWKSVNKMNCCLAVKLACVAWLTGGAVIRLVFNLIINNPYNGQRSH